MANKGDDRLQEQDSTVDLPRDRVEPVKLGGIFLETDLSNQEGEGSSIVLGHAEGCDVRLRY
jgi:hypothetical protein